MAITPHGKEAATDPDDLPAPKTAVRALDSYSAEDIEELKKALYELLETRKPYLDESVSLGDLAGALNVSTKKLSELLNQHLDTSFYNLINQYRVNEVIARLAMPDADKYPLMGIAYECGFQSKASFNRIFKQKTGQSPSAYRKAMTPAVEFAGE